MATLVVVCSAGLRSYEPPRWVGHSGRGSVLVSDSCAEGLYGSVTSGLGDVAGEKRRSSYSARSIPWHGKTVLFLAVTSS